MFLMKDFEKGWYVVYVRSRCEKKVHETLSEHNIESFLPLVRKERKWSDRKKVVLEPLFKSYVFVNPKCRKEFYRVQNICGVCFFINLGNTYLKARDEEIERIKLLLNCEDVYQIELTVTPPPAPGGIYEIGEGPLQGLKCEVLRADCRQKILVRLDTIKQSLLVTLPQSYLTMSRQAEPVLL